MEEKEGVREDEEKKECAFIMLSTTRCKVRLLWSHTEVSDRDEGCLPASGSDPFRAHQL